jgi:hypothetical protein
LFVAALLAHLAITQDDISIILILSAEIEIQIKVSQSLNILCILNIQDYSVLYNNARHPVICEGWFCNHMSKV